MSKVNEDRCGARIAASIPDRARTVAWANQVRIYKAGPVLEVKTNMKHEEIYVGIDVAKARVDVAIRPSGDTWSIEYDEPIVNKLISRLTAVKPTAVLLEATGGLEVLLVSALAAAALPVVVVNPPTGARLR